jgi:hypothetical protein
MQQAYRKPPTGNSGVAAARLPFAATRQIMRAAKSEGGRQHFAGAASMPGITTMTTHFPRLLLAAALFAAAAALGGCETTGAGVAQAKAKPAPEPMSHTQAAEYCWMSTEHGHGDLPLDKRADIVDQCIREKMAGRPEATDVKEAQQTNAKKH